VDVYSEKFSKRIKRYEEKEATINAQLELGI